MLVAFGTWSYSFFLLHQSVRRLHLHEWGRVDNDNNALLVMAGLGAVVLAMSWALYTFLEHPAERWMRHHIPRRWRERSLYRAADGSWTGIAARAGYGGIEPWPDEIVMTPEIRERVTRRWAELGLS